MVPPLSAEDIPSEARGLKDELAGMLPFAPIASLLIELDARTGFLGCFTHAGGRKLAKSAETKRNILAVLIAMATNLGLGRMSEACGVSYDVLAWTTEWYVREDTLRDANTAIVNHHYHLELSKALWGRPRGPRLIIQPLHQARLSRGERGEAVHPGDLPLMLQPGLVPLGVALHTRRISHPELRCDIAQNRQRHIQRIGQERPHMANRDQLQREP